MILSCPLHPVLEVILLNECHGFAFGDKIYNWEEENE